MNDKIYPRHFVTLQEPPVINVERQLDGSLRILPPEDASVGSGTATRQATHEGTVTGRGGRTFYGTSTGTSSGTTTKGSLRIGASTSPIISHRFLSNVTYPDPVARAQPRFEVQLGDIRTLRNMEGEQVEIESGLEILDGEIDQFEGPTIDLSSFTPGDLITGALPGEIFEGMDSDDDDDGDTDWEGEHLQPDSDDHKDTESGADAVVDEGYLVPIDFSRVHLPFTSPADGGT